MTAGGRDRLPETIRSRALQMVKDGHTIRRVAERLNISDTVISNWLNDRHSERKVRVDPKLPEGIRMLHAWPSGATIFDLE